MGSLAGAAHLLNHNAGVLRGTHGEQKSPVEQKGKSPLDFDFGNSMHNVWLEALLSRLPELLCR